jgi:hypothetical protein
METDAPFIGSNRIVVLDPPGALHTDMALVILPADAERNDPVGLCNSPQDLRGVILLFILDKIVNILGDFGHCLDKFGLARIALLHALNKRIQVNMISNGHCTPPSKDGWLVRPRWFNLQTRLFLMKRD